jgi:hypothetical protein
LDLEIERYRRASGITSRSCALGALPASAGEAAGWQRLAGRIAQHQGVRALGFDDLCVLSVGVVRRQEQAALSALDDRRWFRVMSSGEIAKITCMPTLVLRRHVEFAAELVSQRPPDRSARLRAVQAELEEIGSYQAEHKAAVLQSSARLQPARGEGGKVLAGDRRRLQAAIHVHGGTLARLVVVRQRLEHQRAELRQAINRRQHWDQRHQLPLAVGVAQRL